MINESRKKLSIETINTYTGIINHNVIDGGIDTSD
jgi:hypothetical protein